MSDLGLELSSTFVSLCILNVEYVAKCVGDHISQQPHCLQYSSYKGESSRDNMAGLHIALCTDSASELESISESGKE